MAKGQGLTVIAALVAVQILFGVNYVVTKVVLESFPPLIWASIRILIASAFMLTVALLSKRPAPSGRRFFVPLIGFALLGIIVNQSSFLLGLRHTTATNSAVLNTLIPVFTLLIVTLRGQEALTFKRGLGFVFALAGVLSIRRFEEFSVGNMTWVGDLLTIVNCLSYAFFLSFGKKFLERHDRIWTTAFLFLYGTAGLGLISVPDWLAFSLPSVDGRLLGCMVFAVLGGTIATYFLNFWALAHARSSSVALFIYLQPIVAAGLGWAWFGHEPSVRTFVCSGLIFVGMLLGLSGSPSAPRGTLARQVPSPAAPPATP